MLRRKSWTFPNSSAKSFLILKESYQIHLCNFVHFQYIQADIHIHVIQWCSYILLSRDKNAFLYTRQHLSNHRKRNSQLWKICCASAIPCWRLQAMAAVNPGLRERDSLKCIKQVILVKSLHCKSFSWVTASPFVKKKLNLGFPRYRIKRTEFIVIVKWIWKLLRLLNVPVQLRPSPIYPGLHEQTCDPSVLLQVAFTWHLPGYVMHSSISFKIKEKKEKRMKNGIWFLFKSHISTCMKKVGYSFAIF